ALDRLRDGRVVAAGRDEAAAAHFEGVAVAALLGETPLEVRQSDVLEIAPRTEAVQPHAVADAAGEAEHRRANRGDVDRHGRQLRRRRRELRCHQSEAVMLALVRERLAGLPRAPDRAERFDVLAQPRRGPAPRDAEAPLVVTLDLRPETEDEAPARVDLEIPGDVRDDHRASRE